jgi:hypothetical protein
VIAKRRNRNRAANVGMARKLYDVQPQLLPGSITQSGADTSTTQEVRLPFSRLGGMRAGMSRVIEVLAFYVQVGVLASVNAADSSLDLILSTANHGTTRATLSEPHTIGVFGWHSQLTTSGHPILKYGEKIDLTDGAGHGVLVATDSIFFQLNSVTTGATNALQFKLMYRIVEVPIEEYIGIIQSQVST